MGTKERAIELFKQHLSMVATDQTRFRRTVMVTLQQEFNISVASSATHYNTAKKLSEIEGWCPTGLGREKVISTNHSIASNATSSEKNSHGNDKSVDDEDESCFTVIEVIEGRVGRTESFGDVGEARDRIYHRRQMSCFEKWKLIVGLGPNPGEEYRLRNTRGEMEIE